MSMNKQAEKVSFLDEIDIALTIDNRRASGHQMTSVELTIQPIVFRASLRDINLITAIVTRGIELSSGDQKAPPKSNAISSKAQPRSQSGRKSRPSLPRTGSQRALPSAQVIMTTEKVRPCYPFQIGSLLIQYTI